jgi:hypothetical protein
MMDPVTDADRLSSLMNEASALVGQSQVCIRFDTDLLETVYVERRAEGLVATDRGETHQYLDRGSDSTYGSWSADEAQAACEAAGARLSAEVPEEYRRIEAPISGQLHASDVVRAVGQAIDAVFAVHVRPDLTRT